MTFGEWFEEERKRRGWSQAWVARRIGVSRSQMHNIEKGKSRAGAEPLQALCALFETTPGAIAAEIKGQGAMIQSQVHPPDHPGVRALAADTETCRRHRVTPAELNDLASLVLIRDGQPVIIETREEALAYLQALRTSTPAPT